MLKPKHHGAYPDREIDCQEAVAVEIKGLIASARNAGWGEAETAEAIAVVASGLIHAYQNDGPEGQ